MEYKIKMVINLIETIYPNHLSKPMRNLQNLLKQAELVAVTAKKENNLSSVIKLKLLKSNFINDMSKLIGGADFI